MMAVIFEVIPCESRMKSYLDMAAMLGEHLQKIDGFISVERFESLSQPGKLLSLSLWRDEQAVAQWRNVEAHRQAQKTGRQQIFADYRLRIAHVVRDYGMFERHAAPEDSRSVHG